MRNYSIWDRLREIKCSIETRELYDIMRRALGERDETTKRLQDKIESFEEYFGLVYKEEDITLPKYTKKKP